MSNILHEKVLHEYERKRKENKQAYEKKLQEFYGRFPSIKQIDDKISALAIAHAARIISEGITTKVKDAAEAVGYTDALYFSRIYKKRFGNPPSAPTGKN